MTLTLKHPSLDEAEGGRAIPSTLGDELWLGNLWRADLWAPTTTPLTFPVSKVHPERQCAHSLEHLEYVSRNDQKQAVKLLHSICRDMSWGDCPTVYRVLGSLYQVRAWLAGASTLLRRVPGDMTRRECRTIRHCSFQQPNM